MTTRGRAYKACKVCLVDLSEIAEEDGHIDPFGTRMGYVSEATEMDETKDASKKRFEGAYLQTPCQFIRYS